KGKIVDILCVHDDYLSAHPDQVQKLIRGWFRALDLLQGGTPAEQKEAIAIANQFLDPHKKLSWDYLKMAEGIEYLDVEDNITFFQRDNKDGNEFQALMSYAQDLWKDNYTLRRTVRPMESDGSKIFLEMKDSLLEMFKRDKVPGAD